MPGLPNYDNSPTSTSNTRRDKRVDVWAGEGCGSQGIKKGREKTQAPSAGVRSSTFCSVLRAVDRQLGYLSLSLPRCAKKAWTWVAPAMKVRAPRRPMSSYVRVL